MLYRFSICRSLLHIEDKNFPFSFRFPFLFNFHISMAPFVSHRNSIIGDKKSLFMIIDFDFLLVLNWFINNSNGTSGMRLKWWAWFCYRKRIWRFVEKKYYKYGKTYNFFLYTNIRKDRPLNVIDLILKKISLKTPLLFERFPI